MKIIENDVAIYNVLGQILSILHAVKLPQQFNILQLYECPYH